MLRMHTLTLPRLDPETAQRAIGLMNQRPPSNTDISLHLDDITLDDASDAWLILYIMDKCRITYLEVMYGSGFTPQVFAQLMQGVRTGVLRALHFLYGDPIESETIRHIADALRYETFTRILLNAHILETDVLVLANSLAQRPTPIQHFDLWVNDFQESTLESLVWPILHRTVSTDLVYTLETTSKDYLVFPFLLTRVPISAEAVSLNRFAVERFGVTFIAAHRQEDGRFHVRYHLDDKDREAFLDALREVRHVTTVITVYIFTEFESDEDERSFNNKILAIFSYNEALRNVSFINGPAPEQLSRAKRMALYTPAY